MTRQTGRQSAAAFLREQGWDRVGIILTGSPTNNEPGKEFRVTAIGDSSVLAKSRLIPDPRENSVACVPWYGETTVTFSARDWHYIEASQDVVKDASA